MKTLEKSLLFICSAALTIISCKNSNNNNNLLKIREINFDMKSRIPNSNKYKVSINVSCESDPIFQENHEITQINRAFKIVENSNCTVTVNAIEYEQNSIIINLAPQDTLSQLTFNYNTSNTSKETVTSPAVNFINDTGNTTQYAMIKNSSSSIQLTLVDSLKELNEISATTMTQNILDSPEMIFSSFSAPDLVNFTLERKILKRNDNSIAAQKVTLKGPETLNLTHICKVVSATEWEGKTHNWTDTNTLFKKSTTKCPTLNVSDNWNKFKNSIQYLIMSNTENALEANSYRVYKINRVD